MARRESASTKLLACLAAVILAGCCSLASGQRVRKELRSLTDYELSLYIQGMTTMLTVDTATGQAQYGPLYKEYDYFIVKHAIAVADPRGDQGHFAPCFMTYHRALLLEYENALLSVVPELGAMPYWNVLNDLRGGQYAQPSPYYMFSNRYAGSMRTSASNGYQMTSGIFSWRMVSAFNWNTYGYLSRTFTGSRTTGLLRGYYNYNTRPGVVRYNSFIQNNWCFIGNPAANELGMSYQQSDYYLCTDASQIRTAADWFYCVDFNGYEPSAATTPGIDGVILNTCSSTLHSGPHFLIGGQAADGSYGDFMDIATSPNEVMLFMLHHANLDRNGMIWQAGTDPSQWTRNVAWNYPATAAPFRRMKNPFPTGTYKNDVINSLMPFTDVLDQSPSNPNGYTHGDILFYTRPGYAPYTYDDMAGGWGKKRRHLRSEDESD